MFFDFTSTDKVQYSGYVKADSKEEAMRFVKVESIDKIEEV